MRQIQAETGSHPARSAKGRVRPAPEERREYRREVLPEVRLDYARADLQNRYEEILEDCQKTGEPAHISENGAEELVVMTPETFQRYCRMELRMLLQEGIEDERAGRFYPLDEVFAQLEEDLRNGTQ